MDIREKLKWSLDYWLKTLSDDESLMAFTVRIDPYTYQSAENSGNPIDYLAKNLKRHLRKAGLDIKELWFSLEFKELKNSKNPHIHGGIRINAGQESVLALALQKSLGQSHPSNAARKIKLEKLYSSYWITYILKDMKKTSKIIGRDSLFMTNNFRNLVSQTFGNLLY